MSDNLIRIGDTVLCRGGWGSEAPQPVTITHLEICVVEGDKYGLPVTELPWSKKGCAVVDLDNGHWCYGYQIEPLVQRIGDETV